MRPAQPDEPASKGRSPDPVARPAIAWRSSSRPSSARWWGGLRPVNTATGRPSGGPDPHGRFGGSEANRFSLPYPAVSKSPHLRHQTQWR